MAGTEMVTVEGGSELKDFFDLPWKIYAKYPRWVPPLKKEVRRMLDPRRHPFWEFSEHILWTSTWVFSSLSSALNIIFRVKRDRSLLRGMASDLFFPFLG